MRTYHFLPTLAPGWGARIGSLLDQAKDLKVNDYANVFGKGRSAFHEYRKEVRKPDIEVLFRLSAHFGVSIDWIVNGQSPLIETEAILDLDALTDAIETAMLSAEAVREKGKTHTPQQIAAHARALYEIAIRGRVDRIVSPPENMVTGVTETTANDTRGTDGNQALHRKRSTGK